MWGAIQGGLTNAEISHSLVIVLTLLSPGLLWAETPAKPTDPQIAHIAYTAGQIDVEAGKLALEKSKNDDVRAFEIKLSQGAKPGHGGVLDRLDSLLFNVPALYYWLYFVGVH